MGNFSVVNHCSVSSICNLGYAPSSALVSGNRGLGPLDGAEQALRATDKC